MQATCAGIPYASSPATYISSLKTANEARKGYQLFLSILENTSILNFEPVQVELPTRIDVRNHARIIDGNPIPQGDQVWLGKHQARRSIGEQSTILSNVGAQSSEVEHDPAGSREKAQDAVALVALSPDSLDAEEDLPTLTV
ncbi:hypothetical protein CEP52_004908 [Fusarium oligoseptatum]|uniref:Uncharacterized protein n=1 Tax=Fusarium oligoseptatum TaxID=2604345 RepID=A0A428U0Z4_9HYPO|nr:hypothetical protein CEP52_004908 [Fusarium oligoseptatum]